MNAKSTVAALITAASLVIGGAATASADTGAATYSAPRSTCGKLLAVRVAPSGKALFRYRECDRAVSGKASGTGRTYGAPTQQQRKGAGRLLTVMVLPSGKALFRYENRDITAR